MTLTFDDIRSGDRYELELLLDGEVSSCLRFVEGIGRDPIVYDELTQIPQPQRSLIEQKIWSQLHPTK